MQQSAQNKGLAQSGPVHLKGFFVVQYGDELAQRQSIFTILRNRNQFLRL
jgi:hypothetical protein